MMNEIDVKSAVERHECDHQPERMLIASILIQAVKDLSHAEVGIRQDAMRFLASEDARIYAEHLNLPETLPQIALLLHTRMEDFGGIIMPSALREEAMRSRAHKGHSHYVEPVESVQ